MSTPITYAQRQLVWGISSEVAVLTSLSRRIDEHVTALNALRAELEERLLRLDQLVEAAEDADLAAFVRDVAEPALPAVDENFPRRLYGP